MAADPPVPETTPGRMVPRPEGLNAEFYAHCARGELRFQRCDGCGRWRHPPRVLCATCGSDRYTWVRSSGRGRVHTWTVTHRAANPAFAGEVPYAVLVVEMEEGPRLVGNLRGLDPGELALDLPVVVELEPLSERIALTHFRPA
ncbi:MAG: Zn-ribbon domain-containing OB-fold protein [Acidimicrobiia bacterium]|nr:Zn-ribbon domain-containing OB-fold protein [Acidimicrobiia bacterium]